MRSIFVEKIRNKSQYALAQMIPPLPHKSKMEAKFLGFKTHPLGACVTHQSKKNEE
jgi:hypothetical protein